MADSIRTYESILDFVRELEKAKPNKVFSNPKDRQSGAVNTGITNFTGTETYEEALDLLLHGWTEMAQRLEKELKAEMKLQANKTVNRSHYDVAGFQCSVPRYLQGVPTSMINQRKVPQKQPVITLVKDVGFAANVTREQIVKYSIKALMIVNEIEARGTRVNLDIIIPSVSAGNEKQVVRVRIKSASERLNISKVAFPMVHPSMLRRIGFRALETDQALTDKRWKGSYGWTMKAQDAKNYLKKNEYYIPAKITDIDETLREIGLTKNN